MMSNSIEAKFYIPHYVQLKLLFYGLYMLNKLNQNSLHDSTHDDFHCTLSGFHLTAFHQSPHGYFGFICHGFDSMFCSVIVHPTL